MIASLKACIRVALAAAALTAAAVPAAAQQPEVAPFEQAERAPGGEASLVLPPLDLVEVGGYNGRTLLMFGLGVSLLGMLFGLVILTQLKNLPVHRSMREISELIYETCKTYLVQQGKFIAVLEVFISVVNVLYLGLLWGMAA
jgi:K(+)-stimulated pyrophosphate-energized sodium pump